MKCFNLTKIPEHLAYKRSFRIMVICWAVIAVMIGITIFSAKLAHAGKVNVGEKEVAALVMWFTVDGKPQNIWIVDYTHLRWVGDNVVIVDRTPADEPPDAVIKGGLVQIQYFNYYTVFDSRSERLNQKYNNFALQFKKKAGEHLAFEKPMGQ